MAREKRLSSKEILLNSKWAGLAKVRNTSEECLACPMEIGR